MTISRFGQLVALTTVAAMTLSACAPTSETVRPAPSQTESATSADKSLTVHYVRYDDDYEPWNLWLWAEGQEGGAYEFSETDDFGVVANATIPDSAESTSIGIIVRTNDWEKDVSEDRFITNFDDSGHAEVWLIQGESEIYFEIPEVGPKFVGAQIDELRLISLTTNEKFQVLGDGPGEFTVTSDAGDVEVVLARSRFVNTLTNEIVLELASDLDLGASYRVEHPYFGARDLVPGLVFGSQAFFDRYHFDGDLGALYSKSATTFRVWAPTAKTVNLLRYESVDGELVERIEMTPGENGTWSAALNGDQHLTVYNFEAVFSDETNETVDPYAVAATLNGKRGVVVDLSRTNPAGWGSRTKPKFSGRHTDAVFYELHVRDLSLDSDSGISNQNRGKFLALTEQSSTTPDGKTKTGISAIKELGITHLQLLPIYDYASVDESNPNQFNWGYDPLNYNVPEGSYATQPANPVNRITELKTTIQSLHQNGIRVVMDVVYNHVFDVGSHSFERLVPGYFFRTNPDGTLANGTGVGNEVASERSMARKFIVESASYWAREYRLDGFRFDLMGIHDLETMRQVRDAVSAIDPTFLVIGEGWNMGSVLPAEQKANQLNAAELAEVAHFNDTIRDGIKGSVFDGPDQGWATGKLANRERVMSGIVGNVDFGGGIGGGWGDIQPGQSVSYVEAHDNLTLYDKLLVSVPQASEQKIAQLHRFASSIALLAQGLTFIHAGQEFLRSKDGDTNSYKSPDSVNAMRWSQRSLHADSVKYFSGLIQLRLEHPAFRMETKQQVRANLAFFDTPKELIAYELNGSAVGDSWSRIVVIHNAGETDANFSLPSGSWTLVSDGTKVAASGMGNRSGNVAVPAHSTLILKR